MPFTWIDSGDGKPGHSNITYFTPAWRQMAVWIFTILGMKPRSFLPGFCGAGTVPPSNLQTHIELDAPHPIPFHGITPGMDVPKWGGGRRVNIVFFDLRGGDPNDGDCPLCTDTIILLTVDPLTSTAGMLSIPRDMWVNIPGYGYSRINTAWTIGESARMPGGGAGWAIIAPFMRSGLM